MNIPQMEMLSIEIGYTWQRAAFHAAKERKVAAVPRGQRRKLLHRLKMSKKKKAFRITCSAASIAKKARAFADFAQHKFMFGNIGI